MLFWTQIAPYFIYIFIILLLNNCEFYNNNNIFISYIKYTNVFI